MVSKMAIGDIEALKDDGIELTPEEIIRLNAFGLKVERNTDSSEYFVLPRVSLLGDVVFHEPTIGSEIWLGQVSKCFDMDDPTTYFQLRGYSLCVPYKDLPDPFDKEKVKEVTSSFFREKLGDFTMLQVQNALEYVLFGNDAIAKEERAKVAKDKDKQDGDEDDENFCYEIGLLRQGVIYNLGSKQEILEMTVSEVALYVEYEMYMKFGS